MQDVWLELIRRRPDKRFPPRISLGTMSKRKWQGRLTNNLRSNTRQQLRLISEVNRTWPPGYLYDCSSSKCWPTESSRKIKAGQYSRCTRSTSCYNSLCINLSCMGSESTWSIFKKNENMTWVPSSRNKRSLHCALEMLKIYRLTHQCAGCPGFRLWTHIKLKFSSLCNLIVRDNGRLYILAIDGERLHIRLLRGTHGSNFQRLLSTGQTDLDPVEKRTVCRCRKSVIENCILHTAILTYEPTM